MDKRHTTSYSYIPGIDGLRAIAVLTIILYHFDHTLLPGGFTGVDVFFVISGYVISKSLATSDLSNFTTFILDFYKRRILRIVPALLFFLVITSIVSVLFIPNAWLSGPNRWTAISAFFGVSNFYLVSSADGYFSDRIPFNPFVHTWSLAVEEQFYLFFPLVFFIWLKSRSKNIRSRVVALSLLPLLALLSLGLSSYETMESHVRAFYLLPSRFWELAVGAMLFQFQTYRLLICKTSASSTSMLYVGAITLVIGFFYADEKFFPFPWALLPVLGTLLMIVGTSRVTEAPRGVRYFLESRVMTYIGRISYSLYLWHWAVFSLFRWTVGLATPVTAITALLLTLSLSVLSYHLLENTFRRSSYLKKQLSWKVVTGGLGVATASSFLTGLLFLYSAPLGLNLSVTSNSYDWSPYEVINNKVTDFTPVDVAHSVDKEKTIFVIGDSHAGAYTRMVESAATSLEAKTEFISRSGCPIANLNVVSSNSQACRNFEQDILALIKKDSRPGDIVFLASLRMHRLGNQWGVLDEKEVLSRSTSPVAIEERRLALTQAVIFIEKLKSIGLVVLIDAPKPVFRAPPVRCSDWFNRSNPICAPGFTIDRVVLLKHREPIMSSLRELQKSHNVYIWDPFPILCGGPVCSAFEGDKPIFSDGDHLSGYGNRLLTPSFTTLLEEIWKVNSRMPANFDEKNS